MKLLTDDNKEIKIEDLKVIQMDSKKILVIEIINKHIAYSNFIEQLQKFLKDIYCVIYYKDDMKILIKQEKDLKMKWRKSK